MGVEIERKFLTRNENWRGDIERSLPMRQGYLHRADDSAIRVRISGDHAHINIKKTEDGIQRLEYEYEIPVQDAVEMLDRVAIQQQIDKTRHEIRVGDHLWEVDEFHGDNEGLVVAEIELTHADEPFDRPEWIGKEVSQDRRYFNSNLIIHPYNSWQ
jgi:adenylate cyclase